MKTFLKYLLVVLVTLTFSCKEEPIDLLKSIKPGYYTSFDKAKGSIACTKEYGPETVVFDPVSIELKADFLYYTEVKRVIVLKTLYNAKNEMVETVKACDTTAVDSLKLTYNSEAELFRGFAFNPDSIKPNYYFYFNTQVVLTSNDTITNNGNFTVIPEYFNFCTLPLLPEGKWIFENKTTGRKKEVNLSYDPEYNWYFIDDFGCDWYPWYNLYWFSALIQLDCPEAGQANYLVKFPDTGWQVSAATKQVSIVSGQEETREQWIFPFQYTSTSGKGYYDADAKKLTFNNVTLTDGWWSGYYTPITVDFTITYIPGSR